MTAADVREEQTEMDMTPMIDCVFQLIIFFFLVIDLQNKDLAELVLPAAEYALPDEPPPERVRPIVNVLQDGTVIYKRQTYYSPNEALDPGYKNRVKLRTLLDYFANKIMKKKFDDMVKKELPDDALLIRADKWTEMHHVAKIMETCGHHSILIWKVELAVGEPKKGQGGATK